MKGHKLKKFLSLLGILATFLIVAPKLSAQSITTPTVTTVTINGTTYNVTIVLTPIGPIIVPVTLPAGFRSFPATDPWNTDVSQMPVDVNNVTYLTAIGLTSPIHPDFGAGTNGIPFNVIDGSKTPLMPIDLSKFNAGQRTAGWTSADGAGLPIFPGLVRFDEVQAGTINHALRFTVPHTRRAYLSPANHWASTSTDPTLPPMGLRVRLKASVNTSTFSKPVQVICAALKKYGMLIADNGSAWFVSGQPGAWDDLQLADLKLLHGSDLEVVNTGAILTSDSAASVPVTPVINSYLGPGRTPLPVNPTVAEGSILFVEGGGFGSTTGKVQFNNQPVTILSWSNSEIAFVVPMVSTNGQISTITITKSDNNTYTMSAAIKIQ